MKKYLIGLIFFSPILAVAKKEKVVVALDWTPNTNHAGLYVARALGLYDKENIEISLIQPNQTTATQLVGTERAQFGVSFMSDILKARDQKIPVLTVASIVAENTACFAWRSEKKIRNVKDWEGKRYGGWGSPEEEATLRYIMKKNGADFSKLKIVTTGISDFLPTTKKNADFMWIYMGWDGIRAKLENVSFSHLCAKDIDPLFNKPSPLFISSETFLKRNENLARRFMSATAAGYEYSIQFPDKAAKLLLKEVPELDAKLVNASMVFLSPKYKGPMAKWGHMQPQIWVLNSQWLKENKLITHTEKPEKYFTNEFLPK